MILEPNSEAGIRSCIPNGEKAVPSIVLVL